WETCHDLGEDIVTLDATKEQHLRLDDITRYDGSRRAGQEPPSRPRPNRGCAGTLHEVTPCSRHSHGPGAVRTPRRSPLAAAGRPSACSPPSQEPSPSPPAPTRPGRG